MNPFAPLARSFVGLLGLLAALPACGDDAAAAQGDAAASVFRVPVTWARAEAGEVTEEIELVGDVVSRRWAEVAFERGGRVAEVRADLGDEVRAGDVLARLDDAVLREELAVAQAQLQAVRAESEWAAREAERGTSAGQRLLPVGEIDRRESMAAQATARLGEGAAEVARLQAQLAQGELRAPFDAVVARRDITLGSYADVGVAAFALVDMAQRDVHVELPAPVAAGLASGASVVLRSDDLPDLELVGRLDELVPAAERATRTFTGIVRLDELDAGRRLLPGLFVRLRLERARAASETIVPSDAVVSDEQGQRIVVADPPAEPGTPEQPAPHVARIVPVRVLARDRERAAVQALTPGDLVTGQVVLVTGADNVWPGAPLMPQPPLDAGPTP